MYKISVPIVDNDMVRYGGREEILKELIRMDAKRVFLATGLYFTAPCDRKTVMDNLKINAEYFKERGFEVGVWNWTFACRSEAGYTQMKTSDGRKNVNSMRSACPLDPDFRRMAAEYVKDFARAGVELIMFDDDFRYLDMHSFACTCKRHMKLIRDELREKISAKELMAKALTGGKNKYRDAWMKVNGEVLRDFARDMRRALDEVNPSVRMGVCSVMALWDKDGVDTATVSRILAGNTKPFIRLIGAPYWSIKRDHGNSRLQNCIELHRMERSFCGEDIEIFAEGDTFPRPRHTCPASYLELFDMAMRADGGFDGILKYSIDLYATTNYERGYIDRQLRNLPLYKAIDEHFSGKSCVGVRIYEKMKKLADTVVPENLEEKTKIFEQFYPEASRMMANCGIPTVFSGEGVCKAVFGENARGISPDELSGGVILDCRAARILTEAGVDVGLRNIGEERTYRFEHFPDYDEQTGNLGVRAYKIDVDERATVTSYFVSSNPYIYLRKDPTPAAYLYENADGQRFLVFSFDAYFNSEDISRSYMRSREIKDAVEWLSGNKLPAYCGGNPDMYIMAKKSENEMAVGLWNLFADEAIAPVVELDGEYSGAEFINCSGRLLGDKVTLSDIPAFSFAGIVLKK